MLLTVTFEIGISGHYAQIVHGIFMLKGNWIIFFCVSFAACGGGGSGVSAPVDSPVIEVTPSIKGFQVTWSSVQAATSYNLYSASDPALTPDNWAAMTDTSMQIDATTPFTKTVDNLFEEYFIVATAVNDGGESPASNKVSFFPRYEITGVSNQYVRDHATGLEWHRCSNGQNWNDTQNRCDGEVKRQSATNNSSDAPSGWRLPSVNEAMSIAYCDSRDPKVFPGTAANPACRFSSAPVVVTSVFTDISIASAYQTRELFTPTYDSQPYVRTVTYRDGRHGVSAPYNHPDVRIAALWVRDFK
tara:strand:+ start:4637 stop:5542 length:906 start_codon:yes stop_codon:yes gene_type:complete